MNQDQINSLVRTALKLIAGGVVAHGGSQVLAGAINSSDMTELVTGLILAGLGWYASHSTHAPTPATPPSQPAQPPKTP